MPAQVLSTRIAWQVELLSALHAQASTEALRAGAHAPAGHAAHAPSASYVPGAQASQRRTPETFHGAAWCPGAQRQAAEPSAMAADGSLLAFAGHAAQAPAAPTSPTRK
jgi:hypothetical protein